MKLIYKKGDLVKACLNGEVDAAAHQCNCFCRTGEGLHHNLRKLTQSFGRKT